MVYEALSAGGAGRFVTPRHREIQRLLGVMGGLLADLYGDACRLLAMEPRMTTASHLVGHLAREIESGMRQLLTSMVPRDRLDALPVESGKSGPAWKDVVDEICSALGVPDDDGVRRAWKSLAWHGKAHRGPLRAPRPVSDELLEHWYQFEAVLLVIGRRYEGSFLTSLPAIDALARVAAPTKADLGALRNEVPQSVVAMRRFFDAAGPGWFAQLRRGEFFRDLPDLKPDADGMVAYVPWPPARYLARMAGEPALAGSVIEVFVDLETDNPEACESAADAALALPPQDAARLAAVLTRFLAQRAHWALPMKSAEVVKRLTAADQCDAALAIFTALVRAPHANRSAYFPSDLISDIFPAAGIAGVAVLADALNDVPIDRGAGHPLAHSRVWRLTMEAERRGDTRNTILSALRDAAEAVAAAAGSRGVVDLLLSYEPLIFTRLSLHVLRKVPDVDRAAALLTSRTLFDSHEVAREYGQLMRQSYAVMQASDQATIVGFITDGPPHEMSTRETEKWRLNNLARLGDALPEDLQALRDTLVGRYGLTDDEDEVPEFTEWTGSRSPVDSDTIAAMSDQALIDFLRDWEPDGGWHTATVDGLCDQLRASTVADPRRFAELLPRLPPHEPTYALSLLDGLNTVVDTEAGRGPVDLSWQSVLAFGESLPALAPSTEQDTDAGIIDSTWSECAKRLTSVLSDAMRRNHIDRQLAKDVLSLLLTLARQTGPTGAGTSTGDPVADAMASIRGSALNAVMNYARWSEPSARTLEPAVVQVLDQYLDPTVDSSSAIRSVYGCYFGVLAVRAADWSAANVDRIFGTEDDTLGAAAFDAFLRFVRPTKMSFPLLRDVYTRTVQALADQPDTEPDQDDRLADAVSQGLMNHMAMLLGSGALNIADPLVEACFCPSTPLRFQSRLLETCARALNETSDPGLEIIERFRGVWEWRCNEAVAGRTEVGELCGFAEWFLSKHYPTKWRLDELHTVLTAGASPEPSHLVAQQLVAIRADHLPAVVACLALLIDVTTDQWFVMAAQDDIRTILADGIATTNTATHRQAVEIINRLVARGNTTFADLIQSENERPFRYDVRLNSG
jgi:hypothetical protein